jgi:hypothetical protein
MDIEVRNNDRTPPSTKAKEIEGFAVWHLNFKPDFPMEFGQLLGYKV